MTQEGDLVLVYMEGTPTFFARIEAIDPDVKPQWFQVKLLVLQVPLLVITWILRAPYIDGEEFTMGGRPIRMEKVVTPEAESAPEAPGQEPEPLAEEEATPRLAPKDAPAPKPAAAEKHKVISLSDRRKKDQSPS